MKIPPPLIGWPFAGLVLLLRSTCRVCLHGTDPRPAIRARGGKFVYSMLHAHQAAVTINSQPGTAAMVSRSRNGEMLQPLFKLLRVVPMRGSNRRGGVQALDAMIEHVQQGRGSALIAVDGPRGPRGQVRKGIAKLSKQTESTVLNIVLVPRWRIIFRGAWDRFQLPLPFTRIDAYIAEPIDPNPNETVEAMRQRIERSLNELERQHDPDEAKWNRQQDSPSQAAA